MSEHNPRGTQSKGSHSSDVICIGMGDGSSRQRETEARAAGPRATVAPRTLQRRHPITLPVACVRPRLPSLRSRASSPMGKTLPQPPRNRDACASHAEGGTDACAHGPSASLVVAIADVDVTRSQASSAQHASGASMSRPPEDRRRRSEGKRTTDRCF